MWYARMHVGFLLYYLAAGVGALCTLMMYRSHRGTSYLMSYAWTILRLALGIVVSGRAIDVKHHWILLMHILIIWCWMFTPFVDLLL